MPYPIPKTVHIEGGGSDGDRHALLLDKSACKLYELYALHRAGGGWTAGSGAIWNLRSNKLRPAGLDVGGCGRPPIFPGLARYDEVARGVIDHALRFTVAAHAQAVRLSRRGTTRRRRTTRRCRRWACACG